MTREEAINVVKSARQYLMAGNPIWDVKKIDEAFSMAIEALQEVQKHEETFEWCHDCKEYDTENYCCHRWSKVIRNTVDELKADRPEGEWQKVDSQPYFRKHFDNVCCSVCHHKGMRKYNYCPNCGAMMTPYKGGDSE